MSLIFLSHIHEEKDLALIIQNAIVEEFSGFVTVFVSSDGKTIPAGSNFLKRIEKGLVDCVGAIYLISPKSVKRNWINFELGAVWIRNHVNELNHGPEIPVIPICHSGIKPSQLPMPLTNLNSVISNDPVHLKMVFESIQKAVGGKGKLRTNFEELSNEILHFEEKYTIGDNLKDIFIALGITKSQIENIINHCVNNDSEKISIDKSFVDEEIINKIKDIQKENLKNIIEVKIMGTETIITNTTGTIKGGALKLIISPKIILKYQDYLLSL